MKVFRIIGHSFFAVLILFSLSFYVERILHIDSAFYLFKIIEFQDINIEASRYSLFIPQLLPLLAIKLNFPLKAVILIYSLSFVLLYYFVYLICVYKLKNDIAGITILLVLCLTIRDSFFHAVIGTHQGLVYSTLFFAWINHNLHLKTELLTKFIYYGVSIVLITLCFFCHPVTLFPLLFIIGYYLIDKNQWKKIGIYFLTVFTVLIYSLKMLFTKADSYEGEHFTQLGLTGELLPNFFNLISVRFFLGNVDNLYCLVLFTILLVLIYYWKKRQLVKFLFLSVSVSGFLLITFILFHKGDAGIMMEKNFMPLSLFAAIPFVNDFIIESKSKGRLKIIYLVIIIIISLIGIYVSGIKYSNRLEYVQQLLDSTKQFPERKFIIERKNINMDMVIISWSFAIETLLYSSVNDPSQARTIYIVDDLETFEVDLDNKSLFLGTPFWLNWDTDKMDKNYYNLPRGHYRILSEPFNK